MSIIETILIGISLSMDALAVSIVLGAVEHRNFTAWKIFLTAFMFGLFQAIMPSLGWYGGTMAGSIVTKYGSLLACLLLGILGAKMIWEACRKQEEDRPEGFNIPRLFLLAFATSIDALLVGVSYACLGRQNILADVLIIGSVTFIICGSGCLAGRMGGKHLGGKFEIIGGIVLIAIGIKALFAG